LILKEWEDNVANETGAVGSDSSWGRLSTLLAESETEISRRESTAFDRAAGPFVDRIVLFGAGSFGRRTLAKMRSIDLQPLAFADNNPGLRGTSIDGVPVYSSSEAAKLFGRNAVFLVTIWNGRAKDRMSERIRQLKELGCERVFPAGLLFWKFPDAFLPYYPLDLPHKALQCALDIKRGFDLFTEDASRQEYLAQVAFRLFLDYDALKPPDNLENYFPQDLIELNNSEVLVDCGAFDGDTIAYFLQRQGNSFDSIIAFEPDPLNWEKLMQRKKNLPDPVRLKIQTFPQALGARAEIVHFSPTGTDLSKVGEGPVSVECVTLNEALRNTNPTLIKFDIEGAELSALSGADEVISESRPVLAVSAYHEQNHLWKVPLKLAEICKDYEFFLRPQGTEGWDLVCYALPTERVRRR
jgi:FkbM family methyltransferase